MPISRTQKQVYLGLMVGLAMALHIFESMLPMPFVFPGAKLGLANIVSLFVLVQFGFKEALLVSFLRIILSSLLTGTFFSITFYLSFFGGMVSTVVMGLTFLFGSRFFSLIGISILGALTHNLAQVLTASYVVGTMGVFVYLPYLLFFALPTGFFVGIVTSQMKRLRRLS